MREVIITEQWSVPIWLLVHRDMINLPKIRQFLDILKSQTQWDFLLG